MFRLACQNPIDGMAYPDARFEINDSMGVLIRNRSTDINEEYFTYDITEDFEASVCCIIGEEYSKATMLMVILAMYSYNVVHAMSYHQSNRITKKFRFVCN